MTVDWDQFGDQLCLAYGSRDKVEKQCDLWNCKASLFMNKCVYIDVNAFCIIPINPQYSFINLLNYLLVWFKIIF